uniref:Prolylcarboxypeptidase n=1 Tax=Ditylenchus dipsaci TaxID=166011 RepID=A0A915CPF1_9BILA
MIESSTGLTGLFNGDLDPWSGGGWSTKNVTKGSLVSLIVKDGAHNYDMRGAHPLDLESVKWVRDQIKLNIARWIKEANERFSLESREFKEL